MGGCVRLRPDLYLAGFERENEEVQGAGEIGVQSLRHDIVAEPDMFVRC